MHIRLLNVTSLQFSEFSGDTVRPRYAIASHRWGADEVTYEDIQSKRNRDTDGYKKVEAFAKYVRDHVSSIDWLWIDTCCIDKTNAVELSFAINSMFQWYRNAELCIAYLADVEAGEESSGFEKSSWFKRGWTLQELLAPKIVVFVMKNWRVIGNKGSAFSTCNTTFVGPDLTKDIARFTSLPEHVLNDWGKAVNIGTEEKMTWISCRITTEKEDMCYALFGITGVAPGANYGEGYDRAKQRLLEAIRQKNCASTEDVKEMQMISRWLCAPDPWSNHNSARQLCEKMTGAWLLQSSEYQAWKSRSTSRHLWIYGKSGCGKTVLCSTAIEDMRINCSGRGHIGHAIFYFTFSDVQKNPFEGLVRSLIVQLGWIEPAISMLRHAHDRPDQRALGLEELSKILNAALSSYDYVFIHIDALDESSENNEAQHNLLEQIGELLQEASNTHVLITSRDEPNIRRFIGNIGAVQVSIVTGIVKQDIQQYVSTQLRRSEKLSQVDDETKALIKATLVEKADGMFRWVFCQLQVLNRSRSTRPRDIRRALQELPATLDETYERSLANLHEDDHLYAFTLLRWLTYARSPLSLNELAEACIIDPTDDPSTEGIVDTDNRGSWNDTLRLLAGLIILVETDHEDPHLSGDDDISSSAKDHESITQNTKIRLAHFSIQEYLESSRITDGKAKYFSMNPAREHEFIAQSCLVYLMHYSNSEKKKLCEEDLVAFPLLEYVARSWWRHARLQSSDNVVREIRLLTSDEIKRDWLSIYDPDMSMEYSSDFLGNAWYYASLFGLENVIKALSGTGVDVNSQGGTWGTALHAAVIEGEAKIAQMLLDAGADVSADPGRSYGPALQLAVTPSNEEMVQTLLNAGADVKARDRTNGATALQRAAACKGNKKVIEMLLDAGADVNARSTSSVHLNELWDGRCALDAAVSEGDAEIVQVLIQAGADVNAPALLRAAARLGNAQVVQILLDAGADVNAQGGGYISNALHDAASIKGNEYVVQMLLDAGADVNAEGGMYQSALVAASFSGDAKIVQMLLDAGAVV